MKRVDLMRYLVSHSCVLVREGARHTLVSQSETKRFSTVPRHNEINSFLVKKICRDLGVPEIKKK